MGTYLRRFQNLPDGLLIFIDESVKKIELKKSRNFILLKKWGSNK